MAAKYRLVIGMDFSELATLAFKQAMGFARAQPDTELHAVAVVEKESSQIVPAADRRTSFVEITDHMRERLLAECRDLLGENRDLLSRTIAHVRVGNIAEQLAGLAGEIGADMVLVGTHGRRGLQHLLLGSVAERTVRLAPCQVLVVRPKDIHVMDGVPAIEPPCPACIKVREETHGAKEWCGPHEAKPVDYNVYAFSRRLDQPDTPAPYI